MVQAASDDELRSNEGLNERLIPDPPKNIRHAAMYKTKHDKDWTDMHLGIASYIHIKTYSCS